jgi:hypothetical protein
MSKCPPLEANSQLLKKSPTSYGNLTTMHRASIKFILLLSSHLRRDLPSGLLPSNIPTRHFMSLPIFPFMLPGLRI